MNTSQPSTSPRWSAITKLVVALTVVFLVGGLLIRFHTIVGPVFLSLIMAYLLHPIVSLVSQKTPLAWRATVNVTYLIFLIILFSLLTLGGVSLVEQVQSLIKTTQNSINNLPAFIESISGKVYQIGAFTLDLSQVEWDPLIQQVLASVQPALGNLGNLVGALASSAASTLGWTAFIVVISYFFLIESGGLRERIIQIEFFAYGEDLQRISNNLGQIWNAFLRGQMIIFLLTFIVYSVIWTILGVRYSIGLALIAGFANFLPYIGPAVSWIVLGLVTFFQGNNLFGLLPVFFMVIIVVSAIIIDQTFSNLIAPRIMAQALRVHPAAVLIAAIIAANLIGILGVIIAAPLLATLKLLGQYTLRKMLDQDPWPDDEQLSTLQRASVKFWRLKQWWRAHKKIKAKAKKTRNSRIFKEKQPKHR